MEKKLLDYAHYYIGCRCLNTWFPEGHPEYNNNWTLVGVCVKHDKPYKLENDGSDTGTDSIRLILRKLEDITQDEILEYSKLLEQRTDGVHCVYINTDTPESYRYLLIKKIDIFGLIEAGLAIDAATLPK